MKMKKLCKVLFLVCVTFVSCVKEDYVFDFEDDLLFEIALSEEYANFVILTDRFYKFLQDSDTLAAATDSSKTNYRPIDVSNVIEACLSAKQCLISRFSGFETLTQEEKQLISNIAIENNHYLYSVQLHCKTFTRGKVNNPESVAYRAKNYMSLRYSNEFEAYDSFTQDVFTRSWKGCALIFYDGTSSDPCLLAKTTNQNPTIPSIAGFEPQPYMICFSLNTSSDVRNEYIEDYNSFYGDGNGVLFFFKNGNAMQQIN